MHNPNTVIVVELRMDSDPKSRDRVAERLARLLMNDPLVDDFDVIALGPGKSWRSVDDPR